MYLTRVFLGLLVTASLAACSPEVNDAVTRSDSQFIPATRSTTFERPGYTVEDVLVEVPQTLEVSHESSMIPGGDIVWRGDPFGDRHAQVANILEASLGNGAARLNGPKHVIVQVELKRFHALTERARALFGGYHSIFFDMTVIDAETGVVIEPTRTVITRLKGYGGQKAIDADRMGETQKVRISRHLSDLIEAELS